MSALPRTPQSWCRGAALPRLRGHGHQRWARLGGRRHSRFFPPIARWLASRGRNSRFVGSAERPTTLITLQSWQLFLCAAGFANHTQGLTEAHPATAVITHYRCAHRHPYNRRPVGAATVTLHCTNSLKTHSRIEFGRCSCLKGFLGQHKDIKKSVWQLLKFSVVLLGFLIFFFAGESRGTYVGIPRWCCHMHELS